MNKLLILTLSVITIFSVSVNLVKAEAGDLQWLYIEDNRIRDEVGTLFLSGTNLRGMAYNPANDGKYDDWYTLREQDAAEMQALGFNVIRLVTHWERIETSQNPSEFTYNDTYIDMIKQTVEVYNDHDIYVIIDLHQHSSVNDLSRFVPTLGSDNDFADDFYNDTSPTSAREHLKSLWLRMSDTFRNYSGVIGYDIMNEPHHSSGMLTNQEVADLWFDMADYVIGAVRASGDDHIFCMNFAPWARNTGFMNRKLNDENVLYSPHFYYGINEGSLSVINNDYGWLKEQFDTNVNAKMLEFDVPFVMEEQGFGGYDIYEGDSRDVWLKNSMDVWKTNPNMNGWVYWCWIRYSGDPVRGSQGTAFFGDTIVDYASDRPICVRHIGEWRNFMGTLRDADGNPISANITLYNEGTTDVNATSLTDASGKYNLSVLPDAYDIQLDIPGMFIPNFFLKTHSINLTSSMEDMIPEITEYSANKRLSLVIDIDGEQAIETHSEIKPERVLVNGTLLTEVSSLSALMDNTWYYDSAAQKLHMTVSPLFSVTAASGSAENIQTAVNQVAAAGGGVVHVLAGDWDFDTNTSKTFGGGYCGVLIPGGVSVVGAGENSTILRATAETAPDTTGIQKSIMFCVDGRQNYPLPVRISGIKFKGYVDYSKTCRDGTRCDEYADEPEWSGTAGLRTEAAVNFRIDHCTFEDFTSTSISIVRGGSSIYECRGVIDHCTFYSPYKEYIDRVRWGYGIITTGIGASQWTDPGTVYGKYGDGVSVTYIEDCYFKDSRHHTDSNSAGYYVIRHSTIKKTIPETYGGVNSHEGNPGSFLMEVYENIMEDEPVTDPTRFGEAYVGRYMGNPVCFRGGRGVVWGNTFRSHREAINIMHYDESSVDPTYQPQDIYIWSNTYTDVQNVIGTNDPDNVVENVTYFLYEKPGYTPFVYPHPLTLEN